MKTTGMTQQHGQSLLVANSFAYLSIPFKFITIDLLNFFRVFFFAKRTNGLAVVVG